MTYCMRNWRKKIEVEIEKKRKKIKKKVEVEVFMQENQK